MRNIRFLLTGFSIVCALSLSALATEPQPPKAKDKGNGNPPKKVVKESSDDLATIRKTADDFVAAFNKQDAKSLAALWTEDGDYVNEAGQKFVGRAAIQNEYAQFFAANDGVRMQIVIDDLRALGPTAVMEDGHSLLEPVPAGAPAVGKYTAVHVKIDGKWLLASVRDSRVESVSAYWNVADLEWLVGNWSAEEHGAKFEATCRWIANKSFVERTYSLTHVDGSTSLGKQVIGYNPQGGHIQSWSFSSDGGHAIGTWTPLKNGWQVEFQGMTADGTGTSAINVLTPIDENAYSWQSIQRTVGTTSLPDTDEVVIKRQPKS